LESLIGHNKFLISLEKFKFNQPPLIDLPNLTSGNLKQLHSIYARDVNFATASYGHGISISPAHLLLAFNAIASNGKQSGLLFLKDGKTIDFGNIIKPQSAIRIKNLIERVVLNGSGKIAKTAGFRIGGKTGSALVPKENQTERGYSEDIINTFAVILPLTNPQFTILVRIDKPIQGLARVTTVPAAKKIIEFLINYYNLQPDNPEELLEK
jgi:cell division protein FtsI/penicillin-binding protein 2